MMKLMPCLPTVQILIIDLVKGSLALMMQFTVLKCFFRRIKKGSFRRALKSQRRNLRHLPFDPSKLTL